MKEGILHKGFTFYPIKGEDFYVKEGTRVIAKDGCIYFLIEPDLPFEEQPVRGIRDGDVFYLYKDGETYLLKPFDRVPFPFTMITPREFEKKIKDGTHRKKVIETFYTNMIKKRRSLKNIIRKIEEENLRREKRKELADFSKEIANLFKELGENWAYYEWMSDYYKWSAIIDKALGKYKDALNKLEKGIKYIKKALELSPKKYKDDLNKSEFYFIAIKKRSRSSTSFIFI